jgi:hypothetical protein
MISMEQEECQKSAKRAPKNCRGKFIEKGLKMERGINKVII